MRTSTSTTRARAGSSRCATARATGRRWSPRWADALPPEAGTAPAAVLGRYLEQLIRLALLKA